jgi:hypothetical protein
LSLEDVFSPNRIQLIPELQSLQSVENDLRQKDGIEFEKAVCEAFDFLELSATLTATTEAESDLIVEALPAEKPYYIVVECQAVAPTNEVGYTKIGQIRGNAFFYADTRRQQLFKQGYKLIVGRPKFSANAKERAAPDVVLMNVDILIGLLRCHQIFRFSPTQLELIFKKSGEIEQKNILAFSSAQDRKTNLYALIYVSLLKDPYDERFETCKYWTPVQQAVGEVISYAKLFGIQGVDDLEVQNLIRDLDNPFFRVAELQGDQVKLYTIANPQLESFSPFGKMLRDRVEFFKSKLRSARARARAGN